MSCGTPTLIPNQLATPFSFRTACHECSQPSHWSKCGVSTGSVTSHWWTPDRTRKPKSTMKGWSEAQYGRRWRFSSDPPLFPLSILLPNPTLCFPYSPLLPTVADFFDLQPHASVLPSLLCPCATHTIEERSLAWVPNVPTHRTLSVTKELSVSYVQICVLMREVA